ncbi:hypothetical protein EV178_000191 [Coemansia sp. RSA 1646]|nr:hypothetical protein EV178_000191 [Coemansia sp. RSA 1646]KAJ1771340.1 hypothetical protein LPJ74_002380 [Coemansia sp. RSA 1843]KAJ2217622.1 hypothetical protein EV179_000457 [Coemansia sp. RSA 487]
MSTSLSSDLDADIDERRWHGSPVFDAQHWYNKGGMELVRKKHADMSFAAEALILACFSTAEADCAWIPDCLSLGWPSVRVVEIESDVCNVESDARAVQWLRTVQDRFMFPLAQTYRLKVHWAGCTEIFEHPLVGDLSRTTANRIALIGHLPQHIRDSEAEMRFYKYRLLFLVGVTFRMGAMARSEQGALAMYTYLTYIFKTDIFEPRFIELVDAQPQHIQTILDTINKNASQLVYSDMRAATAKAALQSSLKNIRLDMHSMNDSNHSLPFCAAHFPKLESLVVNHSPDFKGDNSNQMSLGVLFSLPWHQLVELQLPFISDAYVETLKDKCPNLQFLHVQPEPRYERWPAYAQAFTPCGLCTLASQWQKLRHLSVGYAFRHVSHTKPQSYGLVSPSRLSFGGGRPMSFIERPAKRSLQLDSRTFNHKPTPKQQQNQHEDGEVQGLPGPMSLDAFSIFPKNRNLRVLRMPYLQLPFSVGLALLKDIPQLQVLEFMPVLKHVEPKSPSITSTLRRRVSVSLTPQFNAPFADPDVVYHLRTTKHPLKDLVLHDACTTRYISTSWIEVMNSLLQLVAVTFVAVSQDDIAAAGRVLAFCARNGAKFNVEIDDQSRRHQTCLGFASNWEKMVDLLWKK